MNWRDIWILYQRELRSALRERAIVVNSILMPIFLYPVMLWMMFTGFTFVEGLAEGFVSRVVVIDAPAAHAELLDSLRDLEKVELSEEGEGRTVEMARIVSGDLDALVEFLPPEPGASGLPDNFRVRIHYDRSVERSRRARERVEGVIDAYRNRWLEREAGGLGLSRESLQGFLISRRTISTEREMGALVLSEMIPLFLVVMVAFGCFYPAIDSTAGERERSTWETLMTVAPSRLSVVTAKYLYVATLGVSAGILNVLAMFASIGAVLPPLIRGGSGPAIDFSFPPLAVPVMMIGAVALGLLFAAAMMVLASFARTFKEGQGMIMPVFWLALLPILLGGAQDRTLTPLIALVPVANVAQMIKDAIRGVYLWPLILETVVVEGLLVLLCLVVARFVLRFEEFLLGSHGGSLWRFLKANYGKERHTVGG